MVLNGIETLIASRLTGFVAFRRFCRNERMKILHLLPTLQRRGAQMFAAELWRELGAHGVAQSLAVLAPGEDEVGFDVACGRIHPLPPLNGRGRVKALRRLLHEERPDVVFAIGGEPFKYAVLARGRAMTPKIVYRKIGLSEQWLGRHRWLKLPFQRWLLRRADAISTVGEATRREAIELFHADPSRIRVIYRGMDAERFALPPAIRECIRSSLEITPEQPVLLTVGALGWEKNQAAMLRVLPEVRRSFPAAILLLAGEGPERPKLERLAADLGIAEAVRFLGPRKDVPVLLAAADSFLLTSLTEGVPGVLIEAGLAGLPCVTWDVAGAREVVQDGVTGRVPPYKEEAAVAEAVIELLGNPDRAAAMGGAARAFCRERFDINRCAEEHVRLFEEVLEAGRR